VARSSGREETANKRLGGREPSTGTCQMSMLPRSVRAKATIVPSGDSTGAQPAASGRHLRRVRDVERHHFATRLEARRRDDQVPHPEGLARVGQGRPHGFALSAQTLAEQPGRTAERVVEDQHRPVRFGERRDDGGSEGARTDGARGREHPPLPARKRHPEELGEPHLHGEQRAPDLGRGLASRSRSNSGRTPARRPCRSASRPPSRPGHEPSSTTHLSPPTPSTSP